MRKRRRFPRVGVVSEINVTPLVDVVLVLLIVFMVVAPFLARGLPVTLPTARSAAPDPSAVVVVTVDARGDAYLGEEALPLASLPARVERALATGRTREVLLRGDASARYRDVMAVLEALRDAGVADVSLAARTPEGRR